MKGKQAEKILLKKGETDTAAASTSTWKGLNLDDTALKGLGSATLMSQMTLQEKTHQRIALIQCATRSTLDELHTNQNSSRTPYLT